VRLVAMPGTNTFDPQDQAYKVVEAIEKVLG
jgi:hypothetical protein